MRCDSFFGRKGLARRLGAFLGRCEWSKKRHELEIMKDECLAGCRSEVGVVFFGCLSNMQFIISKKIIAQMVCFL
jgi:hypothetical protein